MLESLVTWVLNNYVGDYLENLNTDHISVALLSGQVELENVPLKQSALRKLDLPLTVKSGVLGKLTLTVPVTRMRSEAWTLRLSDVLVLLGPESSCKYDAEVEEAGDQTGKQSQLDELEKLHHSELSQAMGLTVPADVDNSWWGASLLSTVLNNIQLIISNVHIRYEDSTSICGRSFCAGVRIQNVVVQTTNHRWKPGFMEPVEGANVFKKLELKGFSFYWNSGESLSPTVKNVKEIQALLSPENLGTNSYVVAPCCIELRMEKNTSKLPLKEKMPRFKFLLRPETIALELSGVQMRDMRAVTREWARFERARPHRKWRPEGEIHGNAKEWWIFAKNRIVADGKLESFRRTWSFALSRAHHLNVYARAYKRRLLSLVHSSLPPITGDASKGNETKEETIGSKEDKMVMRQIERDAQYSFSELSIIRDVVFSRLIRENRVNGGDGRENEEEGETPFENITVEEITNEDGGEQRANGGGGGLYAWMTSFFSSTIDEGENEEKKYDFGIDLSELRRDLPSDLREKEKEVDKEILSVLHDSWDDSTILRKDFLLADIAMRIDHITLRLVDSNGSSSSSREGRVLAVDLMGVSSQVEVSPRTHSISLSLSVHDVSLQRLQMAPSTPSGEEEDSSLMYSLAEYTNILFAMGRDQKRDGEGEALFKLFYRRRSIQNVRHSIEASFRPLAGMYDKDAFAGLMALFSDGDMDEEMEENEETKRKKRVNAKTNTQVNASIRFPAVKLEVRKCGEGLIGRPIEGEESRAIATLAVEEMMMVVESKEEDVTQTRISIGHIELEDMMEGSAHPLLTTRTNRMSGDTHSSSLSSSWPQLHNPSSDDSPLSTSLPHSNGRNCDKREEKEMADRKTSTVVERESGPSNEVTLLCTMYGESESENKRKMKMEVEFNGGVEMGMSRRSWSAILDIMGVIGVEEKKGGGGGGDDLPKGSTKKSSIQVSLRLNSFIVHMEYPGVVYRLGSLVFHDFTLSTITGDSMNEQESMTIDAAFSSLTVVDRSPHSIQYDTRMVLSGERTKMRIVKFGKNSSDECDMRVGVESGEGTRLIYTHTHRYLCAILDFWCQFAELHDLINKSRQEKMEQGGRARVLLDIKLPCMVDIVLPRSYQDEKALVLSAKGVVVHNSIDLASSLSDLLDELCLDSGDETEIDCLLDRVQLGLSQVTLHDGVRRETGVKPLDPSNRLLHFSSFCIEVSPSNFFSIPIDLEVTALRNLSNEESHAIPDMSFLITMRRFRWEMTSRFFKLLRGILELNLGEPLIPSPETIPIEILCRPALTVEVGSDKRYQTLSVRIQLEEVVVECAIGVGGVDAAFAAPLCTIHFLQARLSFDASTDGQAEIDLICERATIVDRRENGVREEYGPILSPLDTTSTKLMGEAHLMLRKDESPLLTVVIVNARILVVPDLLNDIKDFILISPHDIPCLPDSSRSQSGVIKRTLSAPPIIPPQGPPNHIKLTMRDSSLVLMEKPLERDSLGLIAHTTTVLQMTEHGGNINATLEIQGMTFSWCCLDEEWRRSTFSNEFSASVDLQMGRDVSHTEGLTTIPSLLQPKVELGIQLVGLIWKVSPLDVGALLDISTHFISFMTTKQRSLFTKPPDAGIAIGRISLQCEEGHVWMQDELNGSSLPLLRLSAYNVNVSKECDRVKSSLSFSIDFFNQRLFGWEPLIEKWNILRFTSIKKEHNTSIELIAESLCTLDVSLSEQFISQSIHLKERLPLMRETIENKTYRNGVVGGTAHHMAYLLKNSTQCTLTFSTGVDEILSARTEQRKSAAKWLSVPPGSSLHFEFPTILLFYSASQREPPRQLIVRVKGWDETSPINVDASGTYFRVIKALEKDTLNARIVIRVSMEKDGRKQIEVSSSVRVSNQLPHPVHLYEISTKRKLATIDSSSRVFIPLRDAHLSFDALPIINEKDRGAVSTPARVIWSGVKESGKTVHSSYCLTPATPHGQPFWLCCSIRRERYPEGDSLPGHSIRLLPPLTLTSLLPIDAHLTISNYSHLVKAGKSIKITSVNITDDMSILVETDRLSSCSPLILSPSDLSSSTDKLISLPMIDERGRTSSFFITARREMGGSISISLWSPFWVLNKTGIPLIIKQEASESEWAGQGEEHEKANDKHALLFDLADDRFPPKCSIRLGGEAVREEGYRPVFCKGINLSPGVQSIQLLMRHDSLPTRYYNIGVEVRPGTGLYKDTQVVLLTSRFIINNASSFLITACHMDLLEQQSRHMSISPQSTVIWNENRSSCSLLCIKRSDASSWSNPFRIDTIHSNHVTMRAVDDTPLFLRVEVTLHGSVFHVTISDAHYCPAPIVIDNQSEVPVLYQQLSRNPEAAHLRTICKARSKVEYAWDDPSDVHQLNLQVYEKKSVVIDPSRIGKTATLTYDNAFYITIINSFHSWNRETPPLERSQLVLECLQKGKVVLNKQNRVDANGGCQLWRWNGDEMENVGMTIRCSSSHVLDAIDGGRIMVTQRNTGRDNTQKWRLREDSRLVCERGRKAIVGRVSSLEVSLEDVDEKKDEQMISLSRMRPGSGCLHVNTVHEGPSLVVRIVDEEDSMGGGGRPSLSSLLHPHPPSVDINLQLTSGVGLSLVSGSHEELLYLRLSGVQVYGKKSGESMQLTASVDQIQMDNQLISSSSSDQSTVLSCRSEHVGGDSTQSPLAVRPALKLEMNCTPFKHYDSFDVFRVRLSPLSLRLDEILLWKVVHLINSCRSSHDSLLHLTPPDTNLTRPNAANARRCYFGTLDLQFGSADLSVVTVSKSSLPLELRQLKDQYNITLISFEKAKISLPAFRQLHYFETSSFLLENIGNFYHSELRKQTISFIVSLDAFGNPQGLASDLKDSFAGLFIEGDVQRFITGIGYGVSNSVSKIASSASAGVGAITFDNEHEERRSGRKWAKTSDSALSHLYGGVKGLGVGVLGGMTAIVSNTITESKRNGLFKGTLLGLTTGAVDTITKPVQGVFDFVEGTASAIKHASSPSSRRIGEGERLRPPRVTTGLYGLLPPYSENMARAQMELMRINGHKWNEKLLDVEVCLEQISDRERLVRHYVLLSCTQAYVCKQEGDLQSVLQRIPYAMMKNPVPMPELPNSFASIELGIENDQGREKKVHLWCSRFDVARRLADKLMRAKYYYDHVKRSIRDVNDENVEQSFDSIIDY
ncbi:hypothetical protein PENTCL1PPCAC_6331 [Pristionchus entomophagus]|uniref:Vacuolar protein sorting-associated protein n=1 Tax=Pristionchus entomophagus TaxID=358040 RepID=A0AAV5SXB8_9BILA|nr:hypothetical protein PENTCL1PPCAC_6331 [Pristionchus entomophagus]